MGLDASMTTTTLERPTGRDARPLGYSRWFYFAAALLMAGAVAYGFSFTVEDSLLRPKIARPWLLYIHAAVMSGWLVLFAVQAGLVRLRNVRLHRRLGVAGLCLGVIVPLVGVPTAIVMRRFDIEHFHDTLPFIAVPLWDMVAFSLCFGLAAVWRGRPEFHRRLMFLATAVVIDAGLGRFPFPEAWFNAGWFYGAIDLLILAAIARDLLVQRRAHPIFVLGLPLMAAGQLATWLLWRYPPQPWLSFLRGLVGVG
jgi:uncharacterized membrane protein YozB (DUF420 family)